MNKTDWRAQEKYQKTSGLAWGPLCLIAFAIVWGVFVLLLSVALASADRRSENVGVAAVVVPELKLRNIERQIFAADFVIAAHDAALQDRPKTFDGICVDRADNMLTSGMIDSGVRINFLESTITLEGISARAN